MGSLAFRMGRVSPTVDPSATRSSESGAPAVRSDSAARTVMVEFALIVPLLLLVIIAILHFWEGHELLARPEPRCE